jgi:ATP synthase subunit 6
MFGPLEQFELIPVLSFSQEWFDWTEYVRVSTIENNFRATTSLGRWACLSGFLVLTSLLNWFSDTVLVFRLSSFYILNNFSFFFLLFCIFFFFLFYQTFVFNFILHNRILVFFFSIFSTFQQIINELLFNIRGKSYLFLLLFVFVILLACLNISGLIPYSFAVTSYFSVTFFFAFLFFFSFVCLGIFYHGLTFFSLFLPKGTPVGIMPLLIIIELISYLARIFSLSIRLFANITAGHILLKILSWFVFLLVQVFFIGFFWFCCN